MLLLKLLVENLYLFELVDDDGFSIFKFMLEMRESCYRKSYIIFQHANLELLLLQLLIELMDLSFQSRFLLRWIHIHLNFMGIQT